MGWKGFGGGAAGWKSFVGLRYLLFRFRMYFFIFCFRFN